MSSHVSVVLGFHGELSTMLLDFAKLDLLVLSSWYISEMFYPYSRFIQTWCVDLAAWSCTLDEGENGLVVASRVGLEHGAYL